MKQGASINEFLHLGEKALHQAQNSSGDDAITWYSIVIRIYDELEIRRKSFSVSSGDMARLRVISLLGITHEKSSSHIEYLLGLINECLPVDKDAVRTRAADWQSLPIDDIRNLRKLKMRLKIARELSEKGVVLPPEMLHLLDLISILP
ncbi:hypothetical protein [Fluviicola sp.]